MYVWMFVCVCVCVCVYLCMYVCIHECMYGCLCVNRCMIQGNHTFCFAESWSSLSSIPHTSMEWTGSGGDHIAPSK